MRLLTGVLAALTLVAAPAEARIWYDYQDYHGKDGGHLVFSLTSGTLPGSQLIKVHFHRIDASGASGTISWSPLSPILFHDDLSAPLDDKIKLRLQGLTLIPPADENHSTAIEAVGLPEGDYEIDWINLEVDNWGPGTIRYNSKFTPNLRFHVTAGRTEYLGNILVVATPGETRVRQMFGSVRRWGINHWALLLSDEMDRDIQMASSKAELGSIDRAPALGNLATAQPPVP